MNTAKIKLGTMICVTLVVAGCAGTRTVKPEASQAHLSTSNYKALAAAYMKDGKPAYDKESLLDSLEAGKAFNDAGMWKESREAFEAAGKKLAWKEDSVDTPGEVANLIGTTLTSSAFGEYQGKIYEGGLIDYYQAINSIMLGDESGARVDFNRFDQRMDNAQNQFASYKKAIHQEQSKEMQQKDASTAQKSYSQVKTQLDGGVADLPSRQADSKIRISAGQFMSGIFRATSSAKQDKDAERVSKPILAAGNASSTKQGSDLSVKTANQLKSSGYDSKGKVYVIYEDGKGPTFNEFRVDLPLFLVASNVTYTGIALPRFVPGKPAYGYLTVANLQTAEMTNVTNMAGMDFGVAYPGIVTKAITSTVVKTAIQYAANSAIDSGVDNKLVGFFMKLGVGAAQAATTQADTRSWNNLPNTIQLAVLGKPKSGGISVISPSGAKLLDVQLPDSPNALVILKASGTGGAPVVYVKALPAATNELVASK